MEGEHVAAPGEVSGEDLVVGLLRARDGDPIVDDRRGLVGDEAMETVGPLAVRSRCPNPVKGNNGRTESVRYDRKRTPSPGPLESVVPR